MPFYAIAAMSENRVIGDHGKIPWRLPEDFRWYKHKTMGGTLIMGRKTFESIGKPLPGRKTLVLSRQPHETFQVPGHTFKTLFDDYVSKHPAETYWVCGGGEIYGLLLDHCQYLYLTMVKRQVQGDAYFPSAGQVEETHAFELLIHDNAEFRVERWKHRHIPSTCILPPETWPFSERKS